MGKDTARASDSINVMIYTIHRHRNAQSAQLIGNQTRPNSRTVQRMAPRLKHSSANGTTAQRCVSLTMPPMPPMPPCEHTTRQSVVTLSVVCSAIMCARREGADRRPDDCTTSFQCVTIRRHEVSTTYDSPFHPCHRRVRHRRPSPAYPCRLRPSSAQVHPCRIVRSPGLRPRRPRHLSGCA